MLLRTFELYDHKLERLPSGKLLINTLNASSFNIAQNDSLFEEALMKCDVLLPDGISIVLAIKWLTGKILLKIAGADLFLYEMNRLEKSGGKCFFLGSSEKVIAKIQKKATLEYPHVKVQTYSPPFSSEFSGEQNTKILDEINNFKPDVLFIGMTAPKQEKWAWHQFNQLQVGHVCCIGAVFDFYAGTINRAPNWIITIGLEWLYRLVQEPRRMWRRYLIGNVRFICSVIAEKIQRNH